jgi:hypothetical protein
VGQVLFDKINTTAKLRIIIEKTIQNIGLIMKRSLAIILACGLLWACNNSISQQTASSAHPIYDHINVTNTIRCGYAQWAPLFYIDAKTNQKTGIFL